jgi:cell wall-associated NlpC family hydrolase
MTEDEARSAIVAEAMTWLRTPYAHKQRLKGAGVDCAGLPLETYAACGIIPPTDVGEYSSQWHLHRSREMYLEWVDKFGRRIPLEDARAGDFLVYKFGRTFSHGAIVLEPPRVIHAYAKAGMVTIDDWQTNHQLHSAPVIAFTFWGA